MPISPIPSLDFGGDGPNLLFLHANGYPPACYRPFLTRLATNAHVTAMLQRPLWENSRPVRLTFARQESSACSKKVLFPDFNQNALLPEGEQVTLEFTPEKAGEYGFQCQMGMLRGKLIVE